MWNTEICTEEKPLLHVSFWHTKFFTLSAMGSSQERAGRDLWTSECSFLQLWIMASSDMAESQDCLCFSCYTIRIYWCFKGDKYLKGVSSWIRLLPVQDVGDYVMLCALAQMFSVASDTSFRFQCMVVFSHLYAFRNLNFILRGNFMNSLLSWSVLQYPATQCSKYLPTFQGCCKGEVGRERIKCCCSDSYISL